MQATLASGSPMSVSVHFVIGWDGGVWQTADLAHATLHAGGVSPRSIGVELLAALPAEHGIVIPRQVDVTATRGACEHQHAPRTTKTDAAGYLVDALTAAGWASR